MRTLEEIKREEQKLKEWYWKWVKERKLRKITELKKLSQLKRKRKIARKSRQFNRK